MKLFILDKSCNLFKFVSILISTSVKRVGVSRMRDFSLTEPLSRVYWAILTTTCLGPYPIRAQPSEGSVESELQHYIKCTFLFVITNVLKNLYSDANQKKHDKLTLGVTKLFLKKTEEKNRSQTKMQKVISYLSTFFSLNFVQFRPKKMIDKLLEL